MSPGAPPGSRRLRARRACPRHRGRGTPLWRLPTAEGALGPFSACVPTFSAATGSHTLGGDRENAPLLNSFQGRAGRDHHTPGSAQSCSWGIGSAASDYGSAQTRVLSGT